MGGLMESDLLKEIAEKKIGKEELFWAVEHDFELLPLVVVGVSSSKPRVRYGCAMYSWI
jgi:hypothetical protein